ncbi:MAG: sugar phosphate nucleotidyltransferase [Treponema sp.]|nr:sugar phosphate nucleotidyltransferase [Treponema sp.]MDY6398464.1 sugar phosphate nucleotidyltransferase [Treponema sp.]
MLYVAFVYEVRFDGYIILSGGAGTRLWPLSRGDHPKQFLPLVSERY